jgi:DNA-binding winged helix-turn-helix (wHTH) protein/tetratricopeptide (TPR) repeat protein/TolB-like protein
MTTASTAPTGRRYRLGELVVDLDDGSVWKGEERVSLQPKLLAILETLIRLHPKLVSKNELLDAVWPDQIVSEAALAQRVKDLRRVLGDDVHAPRYIATVSRRGYRLVCQVARMMAPAPVQPETGKPLQLVESAGAPGLAARVLGGGDRAALRRWLLAAGAIGLALAAAVGAALSWRGAESARRSPASARRAVAILAFRDLTGRPEGAWLPTALAEMLSAELAAGGSVRVVSAEAVERARADLGLAETGSYSAETLTRLRALLGADLTVSGSCVASGSGSEWLRLDAFVQDASRGETLLAVSESGDSAQFPALVGRLGARLRDALGVAALTERQAGELRASIPAPEAVAAYAAGLAAMRRHNFTAALESLQRAARLDPASPRIHQALAAAWDWLGHEGRHRKEIRLAFETSGSLPRPDQLAIEADYREATGDRKRALEVARTLFDLFPDSLDHGLNLALQQAASGDGAGAARTLAALRSLPSPAGEDPRIDLQEAWLHVSDIGAKLRAADRARERAEAVGARLVGAAAEIQRGQAFLAMGEPDRALDAFERARRLRVAAGDRWAEAKALHHIGLLARRQGRLDDAAGHFVEALAIAKEVGSPLGEAIALAGLGAVRGEQGDVEVARASLGRAVELYGDLGKREGLGDVQADWSRLALLAGQPVEAERHAREALAAYSTEGLSAGRAQASALLACALAAQRRTGEARAALATASEAAPPAGHREVAYLVDLAGAYVAMGEGAWGEAASLARAAAERLGDAAWPALRMQARLAEAEANLGAGAGERAGSALRALEAEAASAGHGLVSRRAAVLAGS